MSRAEGGRRSLFAGAAAVLALGSVPAATAVVLEPDAVLIAIAKEAAPLIAEYSRLSDQWFALRGTDAAELERLGNAMDPIHDRLEVLTDQAVEQPATTLAGFASKAALLRHGLLLYARTAEGIRFDGSEERATFDLLGELIAVGAS